MFEDVLKIFTLKTLETESVYDSQRVSHLYTYK